MRVAFLIILATALASCSDPNPAEIFRLRSECTKIGEAWKAKTHHAHEQGPSSDEWRDVDIYFDVKEARCWGLTVHVTDTSPGNKMKREWMLYDAQTGAYRARCTDVDLTIGPGEDRTQCDYIWRIKRS